MNVLTDHILTRQQMKGIPASSLLRLWYLGNTQAKIAVSFLSYVGVVATVSITGQIGPYSVIAA